MSGLNFAALLTPTGTAGAGIGTGVPGELATGDFAGLLPEGGLFGATLTPLVSPAGSVNLLGANLDLPESAVLLPQPAMPATDPAALLADLDLAQATLVPATAEDPLLVAEDAATALLTDGELAVASLIADAEGEVAVAETDTLVAEDDAGLALLFAAAAPLPPPQPATALDATPVGEAAADPMAGLPVATKPELAMPQPGAAAQPIEAASPDTIALPAELAAANESMDTLDAALAALRRGGNESAAPPAGGAPAATPVVAFAVPAFSAAAGGKFAAFADAAQHKPVRIDAGDFTDSVGARLSWMAEQRVGRAEIRVSPPELGAIDVELQIDGKQVRAEFSSAHADVRQALEAGLPKLRDMLASQGLTLSHAEVGGQGTSGQSGRGETAPAFAAEGGETAESAPIATTARLQRADGLLDEYA